MNDAPIGDHFQFCCTCDNKDLLFYSILKCTQSKKVKGSCLKDNSTNHVCTKVTERFALYFIIM